MLKAFHKKTGKFYSSIVIMNNPSLIPLQEDEWLAPDVEIFNIRELKKNGKEGAKVIFIRSHMRKNEDGTISRVVAHFRLEEKDAILNPNNETEEHKIAKQGIYEALVNGELLIAGNFLSSFKIKDFDIEHRLTSSRNSKIADVILEFEEFHQIYGKGIIFEIQFSHQNIEKEDARTFDRITEGYSILWLKEEDFETHKRKLKKSDVYPTPFFKALKEYQQLNENRFNERVIDMMQKANTESWKIKNDIEKQKVQSMNEISDLYNKAQEGISRRIKTIQDQIQNDMKYYAQKKYDDAIRNMTKLLGERIDYNLLSRNIYSLYQTNISKEIDAILSIETNKILSDKANQITSEIMKEAILEKSNEYFKKNNGFVSRSLSICNLCKKEFDINLMEYEKGCAYCIACFDNIPMNHKKRFYSEKDGEKCQNKLKSDS